MNFSSQPEIIENFRRRGHRRTRTCAKGKGGRFPKCKRCAPGTFKASRGNAECTPCPPGRYNYQSGLSYCDLCPEGMVQENAGRTNCGYCGAGKEPNYNASQCVDCPSGQYSREGDMGCRDCTYGRVPNEEKTDCVCPKPGEIFKDNRCTGCPAGESPNATRRACQACARDVDGPGFAKKEEGGYTVCSPCPVGQKANGPRTHCVPAGVFDSYNQSHIYSRSRPASDAPFDDNNKANYCREAAIVSGKCRDASFKKDCEEGEGLDICACEWGQHGCPIGDVGRTYPGGYIRYEPDGTFNPQVGDWEYEYKRG